jgi:hypothetical protein
MAWLACADLVVEIICAAMVYGCVVIDLGGDDGASWALDLALVAVSL